MEYQNTTVEEVPPTNAKRIALINGLSWAAINIVLFLLVYYGMPELLGNYAYSVVNFLISVGLAIYFTLDLRRKIGGFWSFRVALTNIFVLFFVQFLAFYLFTLVFPMVEPGYKDLMRTVGLNSVTQVAEQFGGGDQDQIDEIIAEAEKSLELQLNPTFSHALQTLAVSVIMYFIGALIFAAIFKRNRPVFAPLYGPDAEENDR